MKKLVYYTLGYSIKYIELLKLSIISLLYHNKDVDIILLIDEKIIPYSKSVEELSSRIKIFSCPDSSSPQEASMRKLSIHNYNIENYDAVIYIDSDILINRCLDDVFDSIITTDKLCAYPESYNQEYHTHLYWSLNNYTPQQLQYFNNNNIYIFNAGLFGFKNTSDMKKHFTNVRGIIKSHTGPYFYEQSFMNYYFNLINNTNFTIINKDIYIMFPVDNLDYGCKIIHFTGTECPDDFKLNKMLNYKNMFLKHLNTPISQYTPDL